MSVMLVIKELELDDNVNHLATDWEVASDISFIDKVLISKEDRNNLTSIIFPEVLDPSKDWYARARPLLSTGYKTWGNVNIFRPTNVDDIKDFRDIPSRLGTPTLSTDSDINNHEKTLFNIIATGFDVIGNSTHESTTWFIEDSNGDVVWSRVKDIFNKNKILVNECILKSNSVYRIKCMFHNSTNDVSDITTYTIKTNGVSDLFVTSYLDGIDIKNPVELSVNNIEGTEMITWEILSVTKDVSESIWSAKTMKTIVQTIDPNDPMGGNVIPTIPGVTYKDDMNSITVPANTLVKDSTYLLKVYSDKSNGTVVFPFFTVNDDTIVEDNNGM